MTTEESTAFDIYPAIDLRNGSVVRLEHGDPERQTTFSEDPIETAENWAAAGAEWLHVVNLDGAFSEGGSANWNLLERLAKVGPRLQFGGGIRSYQDVERAMASGVKRVILGTIAVENPALVEEILALLGSHHVAVGIDARGGRVRTRGWQHRSSVTPADLATQMAHIGVTTVVHTDISRDGVLTGANVEASRRLAEISGLHVIVSGGAATLQDVTRAKAAASHGVSGIILGRALYDGRIDLSKACRIAAGS